MTTPFDPLQFLRLAEWLAERGTTNEEWRTACGRAYYAVFLIMRDRLYSPPLYLTPPESVVRQMLAGPVRVSIHRAVRDEVGSRNDRLAANLAHLFWLRAQADYRIDLDNALSVGWRVNAQESARIARRIAPRLLTLPL